MIGIKLCIFLKFGGLNFFICKEMNLASNFKSQFDFLWTILLFFLIEINHSVLRLITQLNNTPINIDKSMYLIWIMFSIEVFMRAVSHHH